MVNENLKQEILNKIFARIDREKCIVFLFGSFARGEELKASDIDIGILCSEPLEYGKIFAIRDDLNEKINTLRAIDLVDFSKANDRVFIKNAIKEADVWYQGKECKISLEVFKRRLAD